MSVSTKRNVQEAFDGEVRDAPTKKKRRRGGGGSKAQERAVPLKEDKPEDLNAKIDISVPEVSKLEDRMKAPEGKIDLSLAMEQTKSSKKRRKSKKNGASSQLVTRSQHTHSAKWSLSPAIGGIFIDHDPILTADDQYLILPTKEHVNIYSTSTSLLVRSLSISQSDTISCCSVSASHRDQILTATKKGVLTKHDLTTGSKLGRWKIGAGVRHMMTLVSDGKHDEVLAIRLTEGRSEVLSLSLGTGEQCDMRSLLQRPKLQSVAASPDGSVVVACGEKSIHVGTRESTDYKWYDLPVAGTVSSFDARISQSGKKMAVDVVVGLASGAILLYENVLSKLVKNTKGGQNVDLTGRKLHWHRSQVRAVKWSRDGNYVISGGDETVLVIWQLETNQQQFLPHLSTTILNIAVSTNGAHYGMRLGDNSVMVLSTADLTPSTNVTGLSLSNDRNDKFPIRLHPSHANRLLAVVPIRPGTDSATHLQTFDIDTNLQSSRQALTRNITTAINVSPDGSPLQEPNVAHLEVSHDGAWLATVDRWSPTSSDLQALYLNDDSKSHTETVLRFWGWNAEELSWELVARIDEPHQTSKYSVLSLASNPVTSEFATMGENGTVKFWQPRRRVRDGVQVRGQSGLPLFNWNCARSVQVEKSLPNFPTGALAYSQDGSLLAVSWSHKLRHVHLINTNSGEVCMSLPQLLSEGPATIGMIGRHMLCLSGSLRIFDMISLQTTFTMDIDRCHSAHLATTGNTFAIAINPTNKDTTAKVSIFEIESPDQGSISDFQLSQVQALLAGDRGYVVVGNDCKITRIAPPGAVTIDSVATDEVNGKSLEDVFGGDRFVASGSQNLIDNVDSSRNLADVFSATSTATQLGVSELFDRISKAMSTAQVQVGA